MPEPEKSVRCDVPDYSKYSISELRDVERRIDRELFPGRFALVMQEIRRRKLLPAEQMPLVPSRLAHTLAGYFFGLIGFTVYAGIIAIHSNGRIVDYCPVQSDLYGAAIPVITAVIGFQHTTRRPIAFLIHPWVCALLIVLILVLGYFDLSLFESTAWRSYC